MDKTRQVKAKNFNLNKSTKVGNRLFVRDTPKV